MKKSFMIFFLSLSALAHNPQVCEREALEHGGLNEVSPQCFEFAVNNSDLVKSFDHDKMKVIAYKNVLYIQKKLPREGKDEFKLFTIAGRDTKISNILAFDVGPDLDEIFLLNEKDNENEKEILVFKTDRNGNIKPRVITSEKLKSAITMSLDPDGKNILALADGEFLSFESTANSLSNQQSKKPNAKFVGFNEKAKEMDSFLIVKNIIIGLDKETGTIQAFDLTLKKEIWTLTSKETKLTKPNNISFDKNKNKLTISDKTANSASFVLE